ncbi:expressed unknown protein [Seminavis robusta]|uniref:Uncharacterized protein n=1 Tax=Seminavis robusta TaxID=568900 RepID=A0A9N8EDZ2_9STRA|nr:expressed unknown protein [Seminavis robusta]|eukprot:Sro951_g223880.1 n/a (591) ;mRNA; r:17600-19372
MASPSDRTKPGVSDSLTPAKRKSTIDRQIEYAKSVHDTGRGLAKAQLALNESIRALQKDNLTEAKKKKIIDDLMVVHAYLGHCSTRLVNDSAKVAPISGAGYAIARVATAEKNNALSNNRRCTPIQEISQLMANQPTTNKRQKNEPRRPKNNPPPAVLYPPPANGKEYGRREFLRILTSYKKRSSQRAQIVKESMENMWVPVGSAALRAVLRKLEKHVEDGGTVDTYPDDPWFAKKGGAPCKVVEWNEFGEMELVAPKETAAASKARPPQVGQPPPLPEPLNGEQYGCREFLQFITAYKKISRHRKQSITEAIKRNWVPLTQVEDVKALIEQFETHLENGGTVDSFEDDYWVVAKAAASSLDSSGPEEMQPEIPNQASTPKHNNDDNGTTAKSPPDAAAPNDIPPPPVIFPPPANGEGAGAPNDNPPPPVVFPPPANGEQYGRREFIKIMSVYKSRTKKKGYVMNQSIKNKWVPIGGPAIRCLLRAYEKHVANGGTIDTYPDDPWFVAKGAAPLLDSTDLSELAAEIDSKSGSSLDFESLLAQKIREKHGGSDAAKAPSRRTICNYRDVLSMLSANKNKNSSTPGNNQQL